MQRRTRLLGRLVVAVLLVATGVALDRAVLFFRDSPGFFTGHVHTLSYSPDGKFVCVITEYRPPEPQIGQFVYTFTIEHVGGEGKGRGGVLNGTGLIAHNDSSVLSDLEFDWDESKLEVTDGVFEAAATFSAERFNRFQSWTLIKPIPIKDGQQDEEADAGNAKE